MHELHRRYIITVEFMYCVFACLPGGSYLRRFGSLVDLHKEFMYLVCTCMRGESYLWRIRYLLCPLSVERYQFPLLIILSCLFDIPRSRERRTQKLKSPLMRTQSLEVLPLKPGVGQSAYCNACYAYCQEFVFPANFYPSGPFTCIFSKFLPTFSCVSCG